MLGRLRLITGPVLFWFVCCDRVDHAFGSISVQAMEIAHGYLMWGWPRPSPGFCPS